MREVKTQKKYKCDFCLRRGIKSAMERHEKICWRNPNRFCDECKNKGFVIERFPEIEGASDQQYPCIYCSKRDPEIEKGIAAYEQKIAPQKEEVTSIPF